MDNLSSLANPIYLSGLPFGQGGIGGMQQPGLMGPGSAGQGGSPFGMQGGPGLDLLQLLQQLNAGDAGTPLNTSSLLGPIGQGGLEASQLGQQIGQGGGGIGMASPTVGGANPGGFPTSGGGQLAGGTAGAAVDPFSVALKSLGLINRGVNLGNQFSGQQAGAQNQTGGQDSSGGFVGFPSPVAGINQAPDTSGISGPTQNLSFQQSPGDVSPETQALADFYYQLQQQGVQLSPESLALLTGSQAEFGPTGAEGATTAGAGGGLGLGQAGGLAAGGGALLALLGQLAKNPDLSLAGRGLSVGGSLAGLGSLAGTEAAAAGAGLGGAAGFGAEAGGFGAEAGGLAAGEVGLGTIAPILAPAAIGAILAPFFKQWDQSRYQQARDASQQQGFAELGALQQLYGKIPQGDLFNTMRALETQADPRGAVRSYFNAPQDVAQTLGFAPGQENWSSMNPFQFAGVMDWISQDPSRLSNIAGSGDLGYLGSGESNAFGGQIASDAQRLVAKQLGLPMLSAWGLPDLTGDAYNNYYTTPSDIRSAAQQEQNFQNVRDQYMASHPGVNLPSWSPYYENKAASLDAQPPSLLAALYNPYDVNSNTL